MENYSWRIIKPALSDKVCDRGKIHIIEKGKIAKTELKTAQILYNLSKFLTDFKIFKW